MAVIPFLRAGFLLGVAAGVGAAWAGPSVWRATRPLAKSALRSGLEGYAKARVASARLAEEVEDLVAEVAHEMASAVEQPPAPSEEGVIDMIKAKTRSSNG